MAEILLKLARELAPGDVALLAGGALLQPLVIESTKISEVDPNGHLLEVHFPGEQFVIVSEASVVAILPPDTPIPA